MPMSPNHLNKWLALVANFGVIAGIIFLALEIRQSNRIAIASTEIAIRESWAALNESIYENAEIAEIIFKARNSDAVFSGPQKEMADSYVARMFNTWNAIERAYANGMVPESTLGEAKEDIKWAIDTYPSFRPYFQDNVETYTSIEESEIAKTVIRVLESHQL